MQKDDLTTEKANERGENSKEEKTRKKEQRKRKEGRKKGKERQSRARAEGVDAQTLHLSQSDTFSQLIAFEYNSFSFIEHFFFLSFFHKSNIPFFYSFFNKSNILFFYSFFNKSNNPFPSFPSLTNGTMVFSFAFFSPSLKA